LEENRTKEDSAMTESSCPASVLLRSTATYSGWQELHSKNANNLQTNSKLDKGDPGRSASFVQVSYLDLSSVTASAKMVDHLVGASAGTQPPIAQPPSGLLPN
jgi:hypothetical protein